MPELTLNDVTIIDPVANSVTILIGNMRVFRDHHDAHVRAFDHHLWHLINDRGE